MTWFNLLPLADMKHRVVY